MNSTNHLPVLCPKCGHQFSPPQRNSHIKSLQPLRCIVCKRPITGAPLSFGGCFACESCVIAYYQEQGPGVVEQELRVGKFRAARLLRQRAKL